MVCREFSKLIYGTSSPTSGRPLFHVAPGERVSRYLTDKEEYSRTRKIVRHSAFMPPTKIPRKSVYWTSSLPEAEIWSIGDEYVAPQRGAILARGDLNSYQALRNTNLAIELTGKPHPRHADIVGFHTDRQKARLQAVKLAEQAELVVRPIMP